MKFAASPLFAPAMIGLLTLVASPTVSLAHAQDQEPRDEQTGGLARTEGELGDLERRDLGRHTDMGDKSPRKNAVNAYNLGLEHSDKAGKLEQQAARAGGEKAAKKAAKAQESYQKAIEQFRMAVELTPDFYQALGSLGYALLKTGQYEEALEAYDQALEIGPIYPAAIAERGEVYLGLDRIEDAKTAYEQLFRVDRKRARELMNAMKRWLDKRRGDAGGVSEEVMESLAVWIEKRNGQV